MNVKNLILNEKYKNSKNFFEKAKANQIFLKNKKLIDLSFCSGVVFLGHNHSIFKKSIRNYVKKNISIFSGPNIHAVKLSKTVKYFFPNFEKIIFCNSGSESVIKALRISRAMNTRPLVISVTGSWHGSVDQTLFYPNKSLSPKPLSAGLKLSDKKNLIFIPYNDKSKSKKILDKCRKKINCIIVEPIMGCLPDKNSFPYLKFLENYCKKNNIILIFDEIITGFRSKKGSVQNQLKIKPDITLIGKILGGGLPIGAIGISKKIYRKIKKSRLKIFFGGTFSGNTLSTYIGNDVLTFIKNNNTLLDKLIKNCKIFEKKVNTFISKENIDAKVFRFDCMLRIIFSKEKVYNSIQRDFFEKKNYQLKSKFEKFLLKKNIYYPPNGIILLSLTTNSKEITYLIKNICLGLKKYFKIKKQSLN